MSDEPYGYCFECGYRADDFEDARIHVRDIHNGLGLPRGFDSFWDRPDDSEGDA